MLLACIDSHAQGWSNTSPVYLNTSTDDVGIGTQTPLQRLSISGGMNVDQDNLNNGSLYVNGGTSGPANALIFGGDKSGEGIASKRTADPNRFGLDFYTNYINRMTIKNNGQVGIGTLNPDQTLSVVGGLDVDHNGENNGSLSRCLVFGGGSGEGIGSNKTDAGNKWGIDFYTHSTIRMAITNEGKVGIGFSGNGWDGNYKLYVKGGIRTDEVKVDVASANGWGDYVFDKEYKLMSLTDLEKFIGANKHLPAFPSADELTKTGISVSEMFTLQQVTIEETLLHLIEMQKEIKELQSENERLESLVTIKK